MKVYFVLTQNYTYILLTWPFLHYSSSIVALNTTPFEINEKISHQSAQMCWTRRLRKLHSSDPYSRGMKISVHCTSHTITPQSRHLNHQMCSFFPPNRHIRSHLSGAVVCQLMILWMSHPNEFRIHFSAPFVYSPQNNCTFPSAPLQSLWVRLTRATIKPHGRRNSIIKACEKGSERRRKE